MLSILEDIKYYKSLISENEKAIHEILETDNSDEHAIDQICDLVWNGADLDVILDNLNVKYL